MNESGKTMIKKPTNLELSLETMQQIMPTVESVYVMDENQQTPLPLLNLSRGNASLTAPANSSN